MAGTALKLEISGTAAVYCVHDRRKDQVTTEAQVAQLGLEAGIVYDPKIHRIHRCSCCRNLFFDISDEPRYCHGCGHQVHALGGPLVAPHGEVDA